MTNLPSGFSRGFVESARTRTSYLVAGPSTGPAIIFVHGWPELSWSWRHQLERFGDLGFRAIAPDIRGCGQSTLHPNFSDYAQREVVADLIELVDGLSIDSAIWVGHDWGSPHVWNLASHHPERCKAVASLCVPYWTIERGIDETAQWLNREQYPADQFPAGSFEYIKFYHENFERATRDFEADVSATFRTIMRRGDPSLAGQVNVLAYTRKIGGWFGGAGRAMDLPIDEAVLTAEDLAIYVEAYERTGFFGTDALYMNEEDNRAYSDEAANGGRLDMPVLFLSALADFICDTQHSRLMTPMQERVFNLRIETIPSGHWMQQECPNEVNAALIEWIMNCVPGAWPS